jgi:pantoate--beta-alanine ligase
VEHITTIAELRAALRGRGSVGFVPTMGYLHEGHLSLVRRARSADDVVVASIFVNPLQFAAGEDLDTYPRDLDRDTALAAGAGVDLLFVPDLAEMYPRPVLTAVSVDELAGVLEGATRPGHFSGVATVVTKLFSIVGPCRAYFGEKDFQQLQIVRRMVSDLSLPVEVVGCPIVRETDGLAMSSRNVYLTPEERRAAPVLRRALTAGDYMVALGEPSPAAIAGAMAQVVTDEPLAELDYAACVEPSTLRPPDRIVPGMELRLLAAARFGRPRLIDNIAATAPVPS